jgi:hypothetical protein
VLLGTPDAGDSACGALAEVIGQRKQVVVQIMLIDVLRQAHVQPKRERAVEARIARVQELVGRIEVRGELHLVRVTGLLPAREPGRNSQQQRLAGRHRERRMHGPGAKRRSRIHLWCRSEPARAIAAP